MGANVTSVPGTTKIQLYYRNYTYATAVTDLADLLPVLITDRERVGYAFGGTVRTFLEESDPSTAIAEHAVIIADADGKAEESTVEISASGNIKTPDNRYIGCTTNDTLLQITNSYLLVNQDIFFDAENLHIGIFSIDEDLMELLADTVIVNGDVVAYGSVYAEDGATFADDQYLGCTSDNDLLQITSGELIVAGKVTCDELDVTALTAKYIPFCNDGGTALDDSPVWVESGGGRIITSCNISIVDSGYLGTNTNYDEIQLQNDKVIIKEQVGIQQSSPFGILDVCEGGTTTIPTLTLGADIGGGSSRTDSTTKSCSISTPHYDNTEEYVHLIEVENNSTDNIVGFGGNVSGINLNTPTRYSFFVSDLYNSLVGTEIVRIDNDSLQTPYIGIIGDTQLMHLESAQITINTDIDVVGSVNVYDNDAMIVGSDNGAQTRTVDTIKKGIITCPNYSYAGTDNLGIAFYNSNSNSQIFIGGGIGGYYTSTSVKIYTGVNTTTNIGTLAVEVDNNQNVLLPSDSTYYKCGAGNDMGIKYDGTKGVIDASLVSSSDLYVNAAKLDINSDILRLRTSKTPSSASDTGDQGSICWDSSYIYICTATNTWKRASIATW